MPPRVPCASAPLAALDAALLQQAPRAPLVAAGHNFSTTSNRERMTRERYRMWQWMAKTGKKRFGPDSGYGTKYVGGESDQPFPLNPLFRSQPVLSDMMRDAIWEKVVERGEAIKAVSQELQVDVRRIAAVVRLKQVEKNMVSEDKPLAKVYAKTMMAMLPQTRFHEDGKVEPHESINEIPVHPLSTQQLFVPVSESRQFTREDAAKAFHDKLLPVDERSFQKELIEAERAMNSGMSRKKAMGQYREAVQRVEEEHAAKVAAERQADAARTSTYDTGRASYRIKNVKVEDGGKHGRSRKGVGWRYGAPHQDRKRGLVKIPTSVP